MKRFAAFLRRHWENVLGLLGIGLASALPLLHAEPGLAGWLMMGMGAAMWLWALLPTRTETTRTFKRRGKRPVNQAPDPHAEPPKGKQRKGRKWKRWALLVLLGLVLLLGRKTMQACLLQVLYGLRPRPITHLRSATLKLGDRYPRDTPWRANLFVTNGRRDALFEKPVLIENVENLPFARPTKKGHLHFVLAPIGSGKTPLLEQWSAGLAARNHFFAVMHVPLEKYEAKLASGQSIEEILAHHYRSVVDVPQFYRIITENQECLLVLDDLDELTPSAMTHALRIGSDLTRATGTTVVFACRPEALFGSGRYQTEILFWDEVSLSWLEPLDREARDFFLKREMHLWNRPNWRTKLRLDQRPLLLDMATQLDHLNALVAHVDPGDQETDFAIIERLVEKKHAKSARSLGKEAQDRMDRLSDLAFAMSQNGKRATSDDVMSFSGFASVDRQSGGYVFSPGALHAFFAVRGLERRAKDAPLLSRKMLEHLEAFGWTGCKEPAHVAAAIEAKFKLDAASTTCTECAAPRNPR